MAGNGPSPAPTQFLAPPAVAALRQEARSVANKSPLVRSYSDDMQGERDDLREAAEQTLNVIVDLDLEGRIKWVSPSWKQVVGTAPASVEGHPISELLVDNKDAFQLAIESLQTDDSRSRFIRFALEMGPDSILQYSPEPRPLEESENTEAGENVGVTEQETAPGQVEGNNVLTMEGQGIMVYERGDGAGHVSWSLAPPSLSLIKPGVLGMLTNGYHLHRPCGCCDHSPNPVKSPSIFLRYLSNLSVLARKYWQTT